MGLEMEENSELEEGEACSYMDDDENIDPDVDLSYIDERIQHVLGPFQKDFEGGVSAENLGAKFGGYGSFLPTYERSPSIWSHPKTPLKNQSTSRSPHNLPMEGQGASQVLKASSNAHPSVGLGTLSCSDHPSNNSRVPSGDVSVKRSSCLPSLQVADNSLKDETSNRSGNQTDQRTLKFRIKMSSDNMDQKNAIYSGLGLDNSPSSSSGNSSEESGGMPPVSRETVDESPINIVKVMTSFPIPGDVVVSPLHDSLLNLICKEKLLKAGKLEHSLNGVREYSTMLVDGPVSLQQRETVLKDKKAKLAGKNKRQADIKHGNGTYFENNLTIPIKVTSEKESPLGEFLSNGSKCTPLSNTVCDATAFVKGTGKESEVSMEANKDVMKGRLFSSELPKEESLESMSGQDCAKKGKQNSRGSFVEQFSEHRVMNSCKDASGDLTDDKKCKGNKISATLKAYSVVSKLEEDLDLQRQNDGQKSKFNEQVEKKVPRKKEKQSFEGKNKSKVIPGDSKPGPISTKDSLRIDTGTAPKDKKKTSHGVAPCSSKMQKLKSHDNSKVLDKSDFLSGKGLEPTENRVINPRERHTADRPKAANLGNVEVDRKVFLDKAKETLSCKKTDERLISKIYVKDAPKACPPTMENGLTSQIAPPTVAPVVIEEDWVCCDSCQKWRLLPYGTKPEQLPEKWLCSMSNWLPGMNRCDISEEETTKALHALYQLPVAESQNNLSNQVYSTDFQLLDQNNQNFTSHALSNRGKKRHGLNEMSNLGSSDSPSRILNPTKDLLHEPVKSRSLNDMNRPPFDSNQMKLSKTQHMCKPCNLVLEKNISKQKEKHVNGGNSKEIRNKSKRDSDQYAYETSKRLKTESVYNAVKHQDSDIDLGKAGLSLSTKTAVKTLKNDEYCLDKDAKYEAQDTRMSIRKLEDRTRASNGGPLDVRTSSGRDSSLKKRKMKDWQNNQTHVDVFDNSVHDGKVHKDESSESGFRKEKKSKVSKNNVKESSTNSGNDKLNRKDRGSQVILSGVKSHQVDGMEKYGIIDKDQRPRKNSKKIEFQQALDGVCSLKKDLGSGHVSTAATSSSSKVSSSLKIRGNFEEVKGSPVESVSSSPLRTSHSDKLTSAAGDVFKQYDAANGGFPSVSNSKRSLACDANGETNRLGTLRKENAQQAVEHNYDEARASKNQHEQVSFLHKLNKEDSTLDKEKILTSNLDKGKMKVADSVSEYSQKNQKYDSKVDPNHLAPGPGTVIDGKNSFVKKFSIKSVKDNENHNIRKEHAAKGSSDSGMETQVKRREARDHDGSDVKLGSRYSTNGKIISQQNLDSEGCLVPIESKSHESKLFSQFESECKREALSLGCQPIPGSGGGGTLRALPVDTVVNDDKPKIKQSGSASNKIRVYHNSMHLSPDRQGARDVNASSPVRNSSDLTATKILKEAKDLRDTADRLKSSGFASESSEAYFQAALKFLHGAVLLETCSGESGRHGEMTQVEGYSITAKLCELCAHEYERRQEIAAAALAYKCMEVAYMKIVFCRSSSTHRDRHDLQTTLNIVSQGESPSSSASDVDNLNTQVTVERATLSRATSHVAGNPVIIDRNRSSFVRVLDYMEYVHFAMEASRKSLNAFAAVNASLEEAKYKDCLDSIKSVIHFNFQDIEELLRLVWQARESISRSGFGSARD